MKISDLIVFYLEEVGFTSNCHNVAGERTFSKAFEEADNYTFIRGVYDDDYIYVKFDDECFRIVAREHFSSLLLTSFPVMYDRSIIKHEHTYKHFSIYEPDSIEELVDNIMKHGICCG